jgi:hypothetical protein
MASGHVNRIKRPDTWLHRPMLQNVKKVLANPEPSTHGPRTDEVNEYSTNLVAFANSGAAYCFTIVRPIGIKWAMRCLS